MDEKEGKLEKHLLTSLSNKTFLILCLLFAPKINF